MQTSLAVKWAAWETKIDHTHRGISGSHDGRPRWERSCQTSAPTVGWTSSAVAVTTLLRRSSHSDQPHQSASVGEWWGDPSLITLPVWLTTDLIHPWSCHDCLLHALLWLIHGLNSAECKRVILSYYYPIALLNSSRQVTFEMEATPSQSIASSHKFYRLLSWW